MEITKLGKNKVRCLISEQEIEDMGYTLDDIMSNGEETREFMDRIFSMAERQLGISFEDGVKTVRADFLPNHTLSLTFSMMAADNVMEHLKDLMSDVLDSIADKKKKNPETDGEDPDEEMPEAFEEFPEEAGKQSGQDLPFGSPAEDRDIQEALKQAGSKITLEFESFDTLLQYTDKLGDVSGVASSLYKFEKMYYLLLDLNEAAEESMKKLLYPAEEYADDLFINWGAPAVIREHGEVLLGEHALEGLKKTL